MIYCLRYLVVLSRGVMGCPLLPPEAARFLLFLSPGYDRMWAKGGDTFDAVSYTHLESGLIDVDKIIEVLQRPSVLVDGLFGDKVF